MKFFKNKETGKNSNIESEQKEINVESAPDLQAIENELTREKHKSKYIRILSSTVYALVIVAAASILVATLLLPVLEIYGNSMSPTIEENNIVVSVKSKTFKQGDIIAFYYNNRILVKRIVATEGQTVDIDKDGNVYVNSKLLDEQYVSHKDEGDSDLEYPYTVPDNTYFVLGDNRQTSVDSRNSLIGCVGSEEIVGKVFFAVWPLKDFGFIK